MSAVMLICKCFQQGCSVSTLISAAAAAVIAVEVVVVVVGCGNHSLRIKGLLFLVAPHTAILNNKYRAIGGLDPDVLNIHNYYRGVESTEDHTHPYSTKHHRTLYPFSSTAPQNTSAIRTVCTYECVHIY